MDIDTVNGRIKLTRIQKHNKINKYEFNITSLFIYSFDIEYEKDYTLTRMYLPLKCGEKFLAYSESYDSLKNIPKHLMIFRPLKNEKHANMIIDMFDDLNIIESNNLEIKEFLGKKGKKKYSGYLRNGNTIIEESIIKSAPSIPILKISIIAKLLFDDTEYEQFYNNLKGFLSK